MSAVVLLCHFYLPVAWCAALGAIPIRGIINLLTKTHFYLNILSRPVSGALDVQFRCNIISDRLWKFIAGNLIIKTLVLFALNCSLNSPRTGFISNLSRELTLKWRH